MTKPLPSGVQRKTGKVPRQSKSLAERLVARLVRTENGCLEFQGARDSKGYCRLAVGGEAGTFKPRKTVLAHRAAWELANGPIPDGMNVLHECDNPPCCDVKHLFLGTIADNNADMRAKGRASGCKLRGAAAPMSRENRERRKSTCTGK